MADIVCMVQRWLTLFNHLISEIKAQEVMTQIESQSGIFRNRVVYFVYFTFSPIKNQR